MVSRVTEVRHGCLPVNPLPMRSRTFAMPSFVIFPCSYAMSRLPRRVVPRQPPSERLFVSEERHPAPAPIRLPGFARGERYPWPTAPRMSTTALPSKRAGSLPDQGQATRGETMSDQNEWVELSRDCEAVMVPAGHTVLLPQGTKAVVTQSLGGSYTLHVPQYGGLLRISNRDADAIGFTVPPEA